jgi:hypothetical protein
MFGAVLQRMLLALGFRKAPPARNAALPADDDFVARHGLSYGDAPEPLTDEARTYIDRQRTFRRTR